MSRCRGQCYDGASNMSGVRNGVKTQLLRQEKRALYTHCYGHVLSLSVADTIKNIALLRSCMDTTHEISKLLQYSPKRANLFKEIKVNMCDETSSFAPQDGLCVMRPSVALLIITPLYWSYGKLFWVRELIQK